MWGVNDTNLYDAAMCIIVQIVEFINELGTNINTAFVMHRFDKHG